MFAQDSLKSIRRVIRGRRIQVSPPIPQWEKGPSSTDSSPGTLRGTLLAESSPELWGGNRVSISTTNQALSITARMPRRSWPQGLNLPAHPVFSSICLLRARLTRLQVVIVIRVDGCTHEIEEALHDWEGCGFKVEEGFCNKTNFSHGVFGNPYFPEPSPNGRGSPARGSLASIFQSSRSSQLKTLLLRTSRSSDCLGSAFRTSRFRQEDLS
jgi:hypothetical protein